MSALCGFVCSVGYCRKDCEGLFLRNYHISLKMFDRTVKGFSVL